MIGLGIGVQYSRVLASIDPQAQAHYDRVIADGGIMPAGLLGCNAWFVAVKAVYAVTDITTAISAGYDPHYLGAKIGAGSGTTLGQAATKLYSCSGASGDLTQETAASMPLLLVKNSGDANYYFQSGVASNHVTAPNAAANQITGTVDFDYSFIVQSNNSCSFGKVATNGGAPSYAGFISSGNNVQYIDSGGSYRSIVDITSFLPSVGTAFYVRLTLVGTTATCYTSLDGSTWTSRGTATATALTTSNSTGLTFSSGSAVTVHQKCLRMRIYNGLRDSGGTLAADCNPASYNASTSQTQWTSTTGEVWTISTGTATTGYYGVLVDKTIIQLDGVDDVVAQSSVNRASNCAQYLVYKTNTASASGYPIVDATNANYQNAFTPEGLAFRFYFNGSVSGVALSYTYNTLATYIGKTNAGVQNSLQINNGVENTNTYGTTPSGTGIQFGKSGGGAIFQKGIIQSYIAASGVDSSIISTALYTYLRQINLY